jgi:sialidase-1
MKPHLLHLPLILAVTVAHAVDDPRLEARKRAREAAVQSAGIVRALSKEMPDEIKALPIFGEIDWTVKEVPFIHKGPHAGISGAGMVMVDGQIYLMGGFIPAGDETQDVNRRSSRWAHRYDPKTDQWTRLPDLPGRREYTRAVAAEGAVYVLGGASQDRPTVPSAEVYRLDTANPNAGWKTLPSMQVARTHQSVEKIGHQIIVAGGNRYDFAEKGYSPKTIQSTAESLDLSATDQGWTSVAPIPGSPRGWSATAALGGKMYMLGGVTWTAPVRQRLTESLAYDPQQDAWKKLADFPIPISGWETDVYDSRYLITIGGAGARWNDVPFVYDTQLDRWLRITSPLPPGALFNDCGVCIQGDTVYVIGGEGSGGSHFNHFLIGKIRPGKSAAKPTSAAPSTATSAAAVIETAIISQQPQFYHGWPTLARRSTGELILVYSGGREYHVCPYGRQEMIISHNDGRHWTRPRILVDSVLDDRDSGIVETAKGTLLVTMFNSFAYQQHMNAPERLLNATFGQETPAMLERWRLMDALTTQEQKKAESGYWMLRSTDGGVSWSPPYRVPGFSPHGPISLLDGRVFYALANGKKAIAHVSEDDGLTWKELSEMPVRAGELHAVQAADGTLIVHVRDKIPTPKGTLQNTSQILSTDGGLTWTEKQKVADGYPSHLIRLRDDTLLMTYSWRQPPFGIRGKFSRDHGRTWSKEFLLTDDAAGWDLGYPSSVELADGTLLTVWYETPQGTHTAVLRQARWTLNR